ncbi:MAG TPA: iron-containing redox enzyme family protein [Candidatus Angelobacter sp.]|jgi:pyrroloquinoline-quinone synthase|nr:iron-containing redox enzyme family protein [Candidatus Angelobacter sp.]
MLSQQEFRKKLEDTLHSRLTLDHPVLREMALPKKNLPLVSKMALQAFHLTRAFTGYIGVLYYHCPIQKYRTALAVNLYEEETGALSKTANHMELMERFILALGLTREQIDNEIPLPTTIDLVEYRKQLCENRDTLHMGAAAVMIASEGQSLEQKAGKTKDQLIPEMYGLKPEDLAFFAVHAVEDVYHVGDGLDLVSELCTTEKMQQEAIEAVEGTCDRFWRFFDGIQQAYEAEGHTFSQPLAATA